MKSFFSCRIIIALALGRIVMKERIGTVQVFSTLILLLGVVSVAQPKFLLTGTEVGTKSETLPVKNVLGIPAEYKFQLGVLFTLISALIEPCVSILIKSVQKHNTHFSIINSYASYFGVPTSLLLIGLITATGQNKTDYSQFGTQTFNLNLLYSVLSALLGKG